jgi:branched-chain amino acid transport system substrate-binding protein
LSSISRRLIAALLLPTVLVVGLLGVRAWMTPEPLRIGAVFPLHGNAAQLAGEEERGVEIARDLVNADGGVHGRPIQLEVRDLASAADAPAVMASLKSAGVQVVIGAYSSDLSMAASTAAAAAGLVYWEAGAVADQLTGRGLPLVFRVGASGSNLGTNSAAFAATQLASRLGKTPAQLRLAIVAVDDDYARSVADAAAATARSSGVPIVARFTYSLALPRWTSLMAELADAHPDVIVLASHIPDGIAFRRAMLHAGLHVGALIGSTMAECSPDFAGDLGPDAVGVFASDRPTGGFQAGALGPAARQVYDGFATAWALQPGARSSASAGSDAYGSDDAEYEIRGPAAESGPGPTEEGLSGFTAAWALFHEVLPTMGNPDAGARQIAAAARLVDLPTGSLPNGAGLRFSGAAGTLGQNERAAAVIWQWQAVRSYSFVWPATYATGPIGFVPLAR